MFYVVSSFVHFVSLHICHLLIKFLNWNSVIELKKNSRNSLIEEAFTLGSGKCKIVTIIFHFFFFFFYILYKMNQCDKKNSNNC